MCSRWDLALTTLARGADSEELILPGNVNVKAFDMGGQVAGTEFGTAVACGTALPL